MKHIILLVLITLFLLTSCGSGEVVEKQGPDDVVRAAYNAIANLEYAAFQTLACAGFEGYVTFGLPLEDGPITFNLSGLQYEVVSIEGDEALVNVTGVLRMTGSFIEPIEEPVNFSIPLVLENGEWKACGDEFDGFPSQ